MNRKALLNLIAPASFLVFFLTAVSAHAQGAQGRKPATTNVVYAVPGMSDVAIHTDVVYGKGGETQLVFDAYAPKNLPPGRKLPGIIFISGADNAKDWRWFTDYGRLAAASGLIGINYNKRYVRGFAGLQNGYSDTLDLLRYLRDHAAELNIDKDKLCLWAFSAGGRLISAGMQQDQPFMRCLVNFYDVLYFPPGELQALPETERESTLRLYHPLYRLRDLGKKAPPSFIARAGLDSTEINSGIEAFISEAQKQNASLNFVNYPDGEHGFDGYNNTATSRAIIQSAFAFIKFNTQ